MTTFLRDVSAIARREFLRYRRDRAYWIGQLAFPLGIVGFIGFGMKDVIRLPSGADYLGHLASGVLALLVGSGAVGGGMTLIQDRESGFLRALLVAPVSRASFVVGKIVARGLVSVLLVLVLVGLLALFTPIGLAHPWAGLLAIAGVTAAFVALGIALATALRSLESYRLLAGLFTVPLYFLSGIFYPISTLPTPMRWLAQANPLTYGVDLIRYGLLGIHEIAVAWSTILLVGITVGSTALAVALFDRRTRI